MLAIVAGIFCFGDTPRRVAHAKYAEKGYAMTLNDLVDFAIEQLQKWHVDNPNVTEPRDEIFAIADGTVPTSYGDLLRLAAENIELATTKTESGVANDVMADVTSFPVNIIAANVFTHIENALYRAWQEIENEKIDDEAE